MKPLLAVLFVTGVATPALAQHTGHTMPAPPATQPVRDAAPSQPATDPHAGHSMPAQPANPHAGHAMPPPAQPADPHAGHVTPPTTPANPHAGHTMPESSSPEQGHDMGETATDPPVSPPPDAARSGPAHAADTVFRANEMDAARSVFLNEHGAIRGHRVLIDQLEARIQNGRDGYAWDAQGWYGGAIDRLWLKSEGEGTFGESPEQAEVQALWSRALDPWFNLQAGVRYDFRPDPERGYLVLGIEGLAPHWFEVDGALFLSDKGDLSARFEGEYDLRITQRLILQPRAELNLALQDVPELAIGSGLSTAEAGLRLRYEIVPEFAPYVGVEYGRAFGDTARFRRAANEDVGGWSFLVGVRTWF